MEHRCQLDIGVPGVGTNAALPASTTVNYSLPMTAPTFGKLSVLGTLNVAATGFTLDESASSAPPIGIASNGTLNVNANGIVTVTNAGGAIFVTNGGTLTVAANGVLVATNSTGTNGMNVGSSGNPAKGGTVTVNGTLTLDGMLSVAGVGSVVTVSGGTLNCLGGSRINEGNNDGNQRLVVSSGVANLGNFSVTRCTSTSGGLQLNNGVANATAIQIGTANSLAGSTVTGGALTNTGLFTISDTPNITATSGDRRSQFYIQGGVVVSTSAGGIIIANQSDVTNNVQASGGTGLGGLLNVSGGTVFTEKLTLVRDNTISNAFAGFFLSGGGIVYLGSGGIVRNTGAGHVGTMIGLSGGTVAAKADWSSSAAMALTNTVVFKAADAVNTAHNISLSGNLTGTGNLVKSGGGTLTLSGTDTYAGNTTVSNGMVILGSSGALPAGTSLTLGSGGSACTLDLAGFNAQIGGLAVGGGGVPGNQLITNSSAVNAATLTFNGGNSTFGGVIANGAKAISLTIGGGSLTLTNIDRYSGNTTLNQGSLVLKAAGSLPNTPAITVGTNSSATFDVSALSGGFSLAPNQVLSGYGVVTGSVTAATCVLSPGSAGVAGTLTFTNNLTLNGGVSNLFDLSLDANSGGNDLLSVGGVLNLAGTNTLQINPLSGTLLPGTYKLITFGSLGSGGLTNLVLAGTFGSGLQTNLSLTSTELDLVVSPNGADSFVWQGDGSANLWDTTSTNWLFGGNSSTFTNGGFVVFDDTSTNLAANLVGALQPATLTVNAAADYTFAGAGKITGAVAFTKTNSGTLLLLTTNDYIGVTTLGQGTIRVGNGVSSGSLGGGSLIDNGLLLMQQPNNASLSNVISGTGALIQAGAATLTLAATNSYSGGTAISAGMLQVGNGGTLGTGDVTNNSVLTFNRSANSSFGGVISGSGTLTLLGSGSVSLSGNNTYHGGTTVSNGTLLVNNGTGSGTGDGPVLVAGTGKLSGTGSVGGSVTINSGGTLAPGNPVGTLTLASNLTLSSGAILSFDLGTNNDRVVVGGDLSLAGTLNVSSVGNLAGGSYTLITYGGNLTQNTLAFGTMPSGRLYSLDTSTPGQVNLVVGVIATNVTSFPGALGFGANAFGGRKGSVYHVTTLADSGSGSFRDAVSQANRIVVFDVGGYVVLSSEVAIKNNITIAGQTAPGGGIGIMGREVSCGSSSNIIIRYVRLRPGSGSPSGDNGINIYNATNVILDHVSIEFAPYDDIDAVNCDKVTIMNSIIANPIGQQFGAHTEHLDSTFSWFYNIFSSGHNRQPMAKIHTIFINNVIYNYQAGYTVANTSGHFSHDIISNYFITGPATSSAGNDFYQMNANQSIYSSGNVRDSNKDGVLNGSATSPSGVVALGSPWSTLTPGIPKYTVTSAYRRNVSAAGALPRDQVDALVLSQVQTLGNGPTGTGAGTAGPGGGLYTSESQTGLGNGGFGTITNGIAPVDSDGDGTPDFWEVAMGLDPHNSTDATNLTLSGYVQLELYLNWLGAPHAIATPNTSTDINLAPYATGFSNVSPAYSVSGAVNGSVSLLGDGHTARFVPATNYSGLASFNFAVSGSDGTSLTNVLGLLVPSLSGPQNLTWRGDGSANSWDVATSTNWLNGPTPSVFHNADTATFDDTGSASPAVSLVGALAPGSVMVSSSNNYTFAGTGNLTGSMMLTKNGSGALTLNTSNAYSGGTALNGGEIVLASPAGLGTGAATLNSGALGLAGGNLANAIVVNGSGTLIGNGSVNDTLQGAISGTGAWTLSVPAGRMLTEESDCSGFSGTVSLSGPGTYRLNQGAFVWGNPNAAYDLGTSGTMNNRATAPTTVYLGALTGGSASRLRASDQSGALTNTLVVGSLNLDSDFAGSLQDGTGATAQQLALVKVGSGALTLSGTNTGTGGITVSNGTLLISGSTGPAALTVAGGLLGGTGTLGGDLSVAPGAVLSPGASAGNPGTLTVSGNLVLNGASLSFDLSNVTTPGAGVNDLISLSGGTLSLSGVSTVYPNYLNGPLPNGTYTLVNGGSALASGVAANLAWGGLAGTRQSFAFDLSTPGSVLLQVSGSAGASLVWQGTNGSNWDLMTTVNWLNGSVSDTFFNLDSVAFTDSATNGTVNIVGTVLPVSVMVSNTTLPYTIAGGVLAGPATLLKSGSALLTLAASNNYTGGTLLQQGTVTLSSAVADQYGLGTGPVTFTGGTLNMFSSANATNPAAWNMVVPDGAAGRLNAATNCNLFGSLTGGGTFNLFVPGTNSTFYGNWSAFTGQINALTGNGGDFRIANLAGLAGAALHLSNNVAAYLTVDPGADGTSVDLGELSGPPTARLLGAPTAATFNWRVGARNTDAAFNGTIGEQSTNTTTSLEKVGSGTWTLTGSNTYSGGTKVTAGTLMINNAAGSGTGIGDVTVASAATLGGTGTVGGSLTVQAGGSLAPGAPAGTLTITNDLQMDNAAAASFALGTSTSQITVGGDLTVAGTLNLTTTGGLVPGTYTLISYAGNLTVGSLGFGTVPAGFSYRVSTNTPGQVNLVVDVPHISSFSVSGGSLQMSGNGGSSSGPFYVLSSTNVALPLNQWAPIATNQFDPLGNFLFTNAISPDEPQRFYRISMP